MKSRKNSTQIDSTKPISAQGQAILNSMPDVTAREMLAQNTAALEGITNILQEMLTLLRPASALPAEQILEPVTEMVQVVEDMVQPEENEGDKVRIIGMTDHLPAEVIRDPEPVGYPSEWDDENFVPEKDAKRSDNKTGYEGVYYLKSRHYYRAEIHRPGRRAWIKEGFKTPEAAKRAWLKQKWIFEHQDSGFEVKETEETASIKATAAVMPSYEEQKNLIVGMLGSLNSAMWKRWAKKEIARVAVELNKPEDKVLHHYVLQINHKRKVNIMTRLYHAQFANFAKGRKTMSGIKAMTALDVIAPNMDFREDLNDMLVTELHQLFGVKNEQLALATIIEMPTKRASRKEKGDTAKEMAG